LKADLATGGMTLGAGLLVGGVLGALSAVGLARGYNLVRGVERPMLAWSEDVLDELVRAAVLGYLAVAHYGRGRGEWEAAESPGHWADALDASLAGHREAMHALWERRHEADFEPELEALIGRLTAQVLERLYPGSASIGA
jgi:hypothetical protein